MQRANDPRQRSKTVAIAAVASLDARIDRVMQEARARRWEMLVGMLRGWRRHETERRELAAMRPCDFGDLTAPGLALEEKRRWPWQKSSPQWAEVAARQRRAGTDEEPGRARRISFILY
jgi:hypothetical protein